jgi:hypothetical protein
VALAFQPGGPQSQQVWLVLERGTDPSLCIEDPLLPAHRYVHVEADFGALYPLSRGQMAWRSALAERRVRLYGEPELLRALPGWFRPPETVPSVSGSAADRRRESAATL